MFIGPAGSGKTTLVAAFYEWLLDNTDLRVKLVNLDPGVEYLPYEPDFDIRSIFTLRDIMRKEKLGPNGAMIRASESMVELSDEICRKINELKSDFTLIDTPGQMEVFVYRPTGPILVEKLSKGKPTYTVFLVDSSFASSPSSFIGVWLSSITVRLRLGAPNYIVVTKSDLETRVDVKRLLYDEKYVLEELRREEMGEASELAWRSWQLLKDFQPALRMVRVSATRKIGLEELYDILHEMKCVCGDMT